VGDVARQRGVQVDVVKLGQELGIPVVETVAIQKSGVVALVQAIDTWRIAGGDQAAWTSGRFNGSVSISATERQDIVRRILSVAVSEQPQTNTREDRIDAWVLHPVLGYVILLVLLFTIFQAVFSWSALPMDLIKNGMDGIGALVAHLLPDGLLRSLLVDGVIAGVGSVLVFLPQILILFFHLVA